MNKRLMQFLNDLTEENEELESKLKSERLHVEMLMEQRMEQAVEIRELRNKIRVLKRKETK